MRLADDENTKLKGPEDRLRPATKAYCRLGRSVPKLGFGRLNTGMSLKARHGPPAVNARQVADSHAPQAVGHH